MLQNLTLASRCFLKILFLQDIHYPPPLQTTGLTSFQEKGWWVIRAGTESCNTSNKSCFRFLSLSSAFLPVPEAVALRPWSRGTTHLSPCKGGQFPLDCYRCRFKSMMWLDARGRLTSLYKYVEAKAKILWLAFSLGKSNAEHQQLNSTKWSNNSKTVFG